MSQREGSVCVSSEQRSPGGHDKLCGHSFCSQEIGTHKDELSFEQFHLFYKKLMFEQQKSVRVNVQRVFPVSLCPRMPGKPLPAKEMQNGRESKVAMALQSCNGMARIFPLALPMGGLGVLILK